MKINILLFGATAEIVGSRAFAHEADDQVSVADVFLQLSTEHTQLRNRQLSCAINENWASPEDHLADGDELAIFTAVSGG